MVATATGFVVRANGNFCLHGLISDATWCDLIVPNVITPNNDGLNDTFFILNINQFNSARLSIFNMWGIEIYSNDNYGSANNYEFNNQPAGTYFYILNIAGQVGKSGTISLLLK